MLDYLLNILKVEAWTLRRTLCFIVEARTLRRTVSSTNVVLLSKRGRFDELTLRRTSYQLPVTNQIFPITYISSMVGVSLPPLRSSVIAKACGASTVFISYMFMSLLPGLNTPRSTGLPFTIAQTW